MWEIDSKQGNKCIIDIMFKCHEEIVANKERAGIGWGGRTRLRG